MEATYDVSPQPANVAPQTDAVTPTQVNISPDEDWNAIRSQHTFTVTVTGEDGAPAADVGVELILNRFDQAVGDIVSLGGTDPNKVDNTFGRVVTDADGQATLTITATRPGDTDVTAFVPAIEDADDHKVFAVKHWVDMEVEFPGDATNLVGTPHAIPVKVTRVSDGAPLEGVTVLFTIVDDDPDAILNDTGDAVTILTDADGVAQALLTQVDPATGDNKVDIVALHETSDPANPSVIIAEHTITKTWNAPLMDVAKEGPASLGLLKTGEFTVTVTNSGDRVASGVTLTDTIPEGLAFVSSVPEGTVNESGVTWNLGDIDPEASVTVSMVLSAAAVGTHTNQAVALSTEGFGGQDTLDTNVTPGSLAVTKTATEQVNLGDDIDFTITVTNDGDGALTGVVVTDPLPENTTLTGAPDASSGEAKPVQWQAETLNPGDSKIYTMTATADAVGSLTSAATAVSAEGVQGEDDASTQVVVSDVAVAKSVDQDSVVVGDSVTFTITVSNNGDGVANNVAVVDQVPAGLTNVVAPTSATEDADGNLFWTIPSLDIGGSATFTITADTNQAGTITNSVNVTDRDITVTAEASVQALQPSISLTKTGKRSLYIGKNGDYTITATNDGQADLTGVTITDTIPSGMSYVSSDNDGTHADNVVTWNVGDLAVGEQTSVSLTLKGDSSGDWTNRANVTSDQGDSAQASAELEIKVLSAPGAHLEITDVGDPWTVGEENSYRVIVSNQSEEASPMTNVVITATIPTELEIVVAGEGGVVDGNKITYPAIASLAAGQKQTYMITVRALEAGDVVASATRTFEEFTGEITVQQSTKIVSE